MEPFADWTEQLRAELERNDRNAQVGTTLLLEDDRARYWELRIPPGERVEFHRHVLDYVWTCVSGGLAVSHYGDGATVHVTYAPGETRRLSFGQGESMIHDLENTGDDDLVFTTIEYLDSANEPLPVAAEPCW
jgi:mannose-6-phosphate isomerase-like protein (cupin superfamily)